MLKAVGTISAHLRVSFARDGANVGFVGRATLRHLVRHGPRTVTDLAQSEGVTTQAISLRIAPLVAAGLVVRSKDPTDARRTVVDVTGSGRDLVIESQARVAAALDTAIARLTSAELASLATALPVLTRIGDELEKETT